MQMMEIVDHYLKLQGNTNLKINFDMNYYTCNDYSGSIIGPLYGE